MNQQRNRTDGAAPSICFVGPNNLSALAPQFTHQETGGAELQQTLLAKALTGQGFDVSMVVADLGQPDGSVWSGVKTYRAYGPDAGLPVLRFVHPRWTAIWAAVKRSGATIRYSSCAGVLPGQLAHYTQHHPGKVVFRIAHDSDCQPDKLMIPNWRGKVLYRYGVKRVDLILAQSGAQQALMRENFDRDSVVIPSLVELAADRASLASRDIPLLWVANLRPVKRPDFALDLAGLLPEYALHMIGGKQPFEAQYYEQNRERAESMSNVRFYGLQPAAAVNRYLERTRVFVNTSSQEGFPNTYLQSWTRGTPVVAFFDPDGVVAREGLGIIVRSVAEMRDAVRKLLVDDSAWEAISLRCREYVAARHGTSAVNAYAEALRALVAAPTTSPRAV